MKYLIKAYESVYNGYSLDRVLADPKFGSALTRKCFEIGIPGSPRDWNHLLMGLRKAGKLNLPARNRTEFSWSHVDEFLFASEIAWNEMKGHGTLDDILCDPDLANRFDEIARNLAPGFSSLEYRWGALTLRKKSKVARVRAELFTTLSLHEFEASRELRSCANAEDISDSPGLYLITGGSPQRTNMYVGSALNLRRRMSKQFAADQLAYWETKKDAESISFLWKPDVTDPIDLLSIQRRLIQLAKPKLNLGPTAA